MKKLFLETRHGRVPIDPAMAEKYHLRPGSVAPFTQGRIVDEHGQAPAQADPADHGLDPDSPGELVNDGISQMDNGMTISTSEMIDIAQGVDSSMQ